MNTKTDELMKLKELVRKFLDETRNVPYRNVDCDQAIVYDLMNQLGKAVDK